MIGDRCEPRLGFARVAGRVGVVVPLQRRQNQAVILNGGLPVGLGVALLRGAAGDSGECHESGEEHDRAKQPERHHGREVAGEPHAGAERPPRRRRGEGNAKGVRCVFAGFAGVFAGCSSLQSAIGHEPPSLVSLRSGSVSQAE